MERKSLNAEATPGLARDGSVGVVVVNHERPDSTRRCLAALGRLTHANWFLVLVDNGCADFSPEAVAAVSPRGAHLHSDSNRGFAGGSNLGMRAALERGADWLWFLNDDAEPEPESLNELLAVAQAPPWPAIVGPKVLRGDRPEQLDSVGLEIDLASGRLRLVGHGEIDRGQYDLLTDPVAVTGCAMLVRAETCVLLNGFEETYFAYMEDADLCLRARQAARRIAFAPRARVLHHRAPASGGRQSIESLYYSTRNHLWLLHWHSPGPPWQRKVQELRVMALGAAYALRARTGAPLAALRAVRRGVRDFRRGAFGGLPPP
jgi:hypothetical protein